MMKGYVNGVKQGKFTIGYDTEGRKLLLRDFSSSGGHPTIEVYSSTGKKKTEIKFEVKKWR